MLFSGLITEIIALTGGLTIDFTILMIVFCLFSGGFLEDIHLRQEK